MYFAGVSKGVASKKRMLSNMRSDIPKAHSCLQKGSDKTICKWFRFALIVNQRARTAVRD
jgi:hypothetical protein